MNEEKLILTQEWDKTFSKSDKTEHRKVTFHNRYGITLAADMYTPKDASGRLPAIAVCGPVRCSKGAVQRSVCPDPCRARLPYSRIRSVIHR